MRTRRDEDRDNDITAVDCEACGDEGYTQQSGGNIARFCCDAHPTTFDICETCCEDFHRYGLALPEDDRDLTQAEWDQLRGYINTERKSRDDETLVPELAQKFSAILHEWLTPRTNFGSDHPERRRNRQRRVPHPRPLRRQPGHARRLGMDVRPGTGPRPHR